MAKNHFSLLEESEQQEGERLVETVYAQLNRDLRFGVYPPGSKLKFNDLCKRYEASANTIRDALGRLVSEGFVDAEGQRGAKVATITLRDLHDVTETRILLECQAAKQSLALADLQWEGEIMAAHYRLAKAEEMAFEDHANHRNLLERFDHDFHRTIISGCQSPWILRLHAMMYDHMLRYRSHALKAVDENTLSHMLERSQRDHVLLRDVALDKDADKLVELLQNHMRSGEAFAKNAFLK